MNKLSTQKRKWLVVSLSAVAIAILSLMSWQTKTAVVEEVSYGEALQPALSFSEDLSKIPGGVQPKAENPFNEDPEKPTELKEVQTAAPQEKLAFKEPEPVLPASLLVDPPTASSLRIHRVEKGETLSSISRLYYGTPHGWQDIYEANRDKITNKNSIKSGTLLNIPNRK